MLRPSKEENLTGNLLVQGARVLLLLKGGAMTIDDLRLNFYRNNSDMPPVDRVMDIITFLYLSNLVIMEGAYVKVSREPSE